ncbi:MAG TPA: plastocyanin/azurin family copper-binding protein [Gaiellales bacterium]|nr:plastocyanin/azurin family copper-binding protein [Gaiellales bacterium]
MKLRQAIALVLLPAVLLAASCGGSSSGGSSSGGSSTSSTPTSTPAGGGQVIDIPISSSGFSFTKTSVTAKAGTVTLKAMNPQSVAHDISIKGNGVNVQGNQVDNGGTSTVTANLKPGTYEFYCSVPGHEQAGMKGTLTVS